MTIAPTTGQRPSGNLYCPRCSTPLPQYANFCAYCGELVNKKMKIPQVMPEQSAVHWLWPLIIIFSTIAAGLVSFVFTDTPLRPIIVFWFLFVCPGMALVRFLRLNEPVVEWVLALALSFAIDAIVAAIQLYAGRWFPFGTFSLLIGFSFGGAIVQLIISSPVVFIAKKPQIPFSGKAGVFLSIALTLLITLVVGGGLWSYAAYLGSPHTETPTLAQQHKATPTSVARFSCQTTPPDGVLTSYPHISKAYIGTLYDIPADLATNISLSNIQQRQKNICGLLSKISTNSHYTGLNINGPFKGNITPTKEVLFTVTGQTTISFDGEIRPDGSIVGTYCSEKEITGACGDYGLWSIIPAPGD